MAGPQDGWTLRCFKKFNFYYIELLSFDAVLKQQQDSNYHNEKLQKQWIIANITLEKKGNRS